MGSMKDVMKDVAKKYGDKTFINSHEIEVVDRIPTGIFPLDLALGGGIPRRRLTMIAGPNGSNKTNITFKLIRMHQMLWPDKYCIFIDIEGTFDPEWAAQFGIDLDWLHVVRPDFAEQAVDITVDLIRADDVGLIIIDSLGAMISKKEIENSAEIASVGGAALLIPRFCKKITVECSKAEKEGRSPTVVAINQVRTKIGQLYGDPETVSGGNALLHTLTLFIRVYGKPIKDAKADTEQPVWRETNFTLKKNKMKVVATTGKFTMAMLKNGYFDVGDTDDWNTISNYLKDLGFLSKKEGSKGGWIMLDKEYPTLDKCRDAVYGDAKYGAEIRAAIVHRVMKDCEVI